MLVQLIV